MITIPPIPPGKNPYDNPREPPEWREAWYACDKPTCNARRVGLGWHLPDCPNRRHRNGRDD